MSERFSFCLTTLLSDVITKDPTYRDKVRDTMFRVNQCVGSILGKSDIKRGTLGCLALRYFERAPGLNPICNGKYYIEMANTAIFLKCEWDENGQSLSSDQYHRWIKSITCIIVFI